MADPNSIDPNNLEQTTPAESRPDLAGTLATAIDEHLVELDKAIEACPGVDAFTLSSGVRVNMMPGKGRHLLAAQRAAGSDPHQVMYALAAGICTFDGTQRVMEDILDMPLGDVMQLMAKIGDKYGNDFLSTSGPSSTSPQ